MAIYETVFMARQELNTKQVEELANRFSKILTDNGGKILKTESWGLRTLAYKINKSKKAHYTLIESDAPGAALIEMERVMRLDEDVMRYMTIKLDAPTEEASIILRGNDTDEKEAA